MSLFAYCRIGDSAWLRITVDVRCVFVKARFLDLLRLRRVPVQKDANRHPQSRTSEVETRHALDPVIEATEIVHTVNELQCEDRWGWLAYDELSKALLASSS